MIFLVSLGRFLAQIKIPSMKGHFLRGRASSIKVTAMSTWRFLFPLASQQQSYRFSLDPRFISENHIACGMVSNCTEIPPVVPDMVQYQKYIMGPPNVM